MNNKTRHGTQAGFSLIEILVVIGIIAILASIVLIAINPARQFAQARNTQRVSNITAILNAIGQRIADNKGIFETGCTAGAIPATAKTIASDDYAIAACLVPIYMSALPFDPSATDAHYTNDTDYKSGYTVLKDATTGRITVAAPGAELDQTITLTR